MPADMRLGALLLCLLAGTARAAPAPTATAIALEKGAVGTFYVQAGLQGFGDLALLVDTGSSHLVINESILAGLQAGSARYSHELEGRMADGSLRRLPVYRLAGLRLGAACWISDVEAVVFPRDTRPILGMNVLSRLAPFTFSAQPPQLSLNQCELAQDLAITRANAPAPP